eukprot:1748300-Amphidinium_carterae.1
MKTWVEGRLTMDSVQSVMVINGLVKTGKSANLRVLLPSVIQESLIDLTKSADSKVLSREALICELDCAQILARGDLRATATNKFAKELG